VASQKFQLKVVSGVKSEILHVFDQNVVTIGRGVGSDLRIENGIVSRQHAELLRSSKGFTLFAQSKTNPVSVDDAVVTPDQTAPLTDGSRIVLSNKVVIDFSLVSEDAQPTAAPEPSSPDAEEAQTDQFSADLLKQVRSSLSSRAEGTASASKPASSKLSSPKPASSSLSRSKPASSSLSRSKPASSSLSRSKPASSSLSRSKPASSSLSRPTTPVSSSRTKGLLDPPLESLGKATQVPEDPNRDPQAQAQPSAKRASREQNPLLSKLFSKAPEVVEVVSGPRPREGKPGAAIRIEGLAGKTRVEVYDDLLIGAGPDSDVVIQGAYAPRRAAVAVRVGDRYRLYNVSPSPQTVRLNGRAIEGQAALQDGDELEVYGVRLRVAIPAR